MKLMWYVEKPVKDTIAKAVVFNGEDLKDYLDNGYKVTGKYEIKLIEGDDYLPEAIEED